MGNSPAKLFTTYRELDRHNHAPKRFAISPGSSAVSPGLATAHKFEEFLEFGLLTNWKNSSYIAQIRGIPSDLWRNSAHFESSGKMHN